MYQQKNGSKYRAKSTVYNGTYYHSRLEAAYAMELDMRLKAKDIKSWTGQIRTPFVVNGIKICTYIVDFRIEHNDGSIEFVETKGFVTDVGRIKMRMFEAIYLPEHPEARFTVVKQGR